MRRASRAIAAFRPTARAARPSRLGHRRSAARWPAEARVESVRGDKKQPIAFEIKEVAPGLGGRPGASLSEALGGDPHPAGETGPELRGLGVLSASGLAGGDARGRTKMRFMHASAAQNAWGTREPNTFEIVC